MDWMWINEKPEDGGYGSFSRPCSKCGNYIPAGWKYAWCKECAEKGICIHGNKVEECDKCYTESDQAYDANREKR